MPDSAIASGLVDFAIPVDAMASKLIENLGSFNKFEALVGRPRANDDGRAVAEAREAICAILFSQTGHDFSGYKTRTFMRRVQRRMQARQCEAVENYVAYLRENPDEAGLLFRDLLINVTSFFRDKDAFAALEQTVIPRLFEEKGTVRLGAGVGAGLRHGRGSRFHRHPVARAHGQASRRAARDDLRHRGR